MCYFKTSLCAVYFLELEKYVVGTKEGKVMKFVEHNNMDIYVTGKVRVARSFLDQVICTGFALKFI